MASIIVDAFDMCPIELLAVAQVEDRETGRETEGPAHSAFCERSDRSLVQSALGHRLGLELERSVREASSAAAARERVLMTRAAHGIARRD